MPGGWHYQPQAIALQLQVGTSQALHLPPLLAGLTSCHRRSLDGGGVLKDRRRLVSVTPATAPLASTSPGPGTLRLSSAVGSRDWSSIGDRGLSSLGRRYADRGGDGGGRQTSRNLRRDGDRSSWDNRGGVDHSRIRRRGRGSIGRNAYNRMCRPGRDRRSRDDRSRIGSGGSAGSRSPCQRWLSRRLGNYRC
jgi:hypothetical protein